MSHQGLKSYVSRVQVVLDRYQARAEWLLKGEHNYNSWGRLINKPLNADKHKYFGAVLESKVILVLDASSSMVTHWPEVKSGVTKLICNFPPHIKR